MTMIKTKSDIIDDISRYKALLDQFGCARFEAGVQDETLLRKKILEIAILLGEPAVGRSKQMIESLTPRESKTINFPSLSKKYGLNEFPFHTDAAHWITPCRYIVLACLNPGLSSVPTLLLDRERVKLSEAERQLLRSGVFYVKNGRSSFYSSILGRDSRFLRFDPGCMEPETPEAVQALLLYSQARVLHLVEKIVWQRGSIIILDNWRMLHARGNALAVDSGRVLLRCLVE